MEAENVTQLTTTLSLAWALSMARVILSFAITINFVIIISTMNQKSYHHHIYLNVVKHQILRVWSFS